MKQRFAVLVDGERPKIYKVPFNKTARIINELPFQYVEFFENLKDAKVATWALAENCESLPTSLIEELQNKLFQLTEDRVETYFL